MPASRFCCIVAGVDPGADVDRVLPLATALAADAGLPLETVAVVPEGGDGWEPEPPAGLPRGAYVLRDDDPGRALSGHVAGRAGALLVVGATPWGPPGDRQLGAVTEQVLADARVPVLVVGPRAERYRGRIVPVAAVDGTALADAAVEAVGVWVRTFTGTGARLVEVVPADGWPAGAGTPEVGHLRPLVARCAEQGIDAEAVVLRAGDAAAALGDYAAATPDALLVVASPRWPGEPTHWYSTARELVCTSARPALVVPTDAP